MPDGAPTPTLRADLDAEAVCVGMALMDHDAALELVEVLDPEDYWSGPNRFIHLAIRAVLARGDRVDVTMVMVELRATQREKQVGGSSYLAQLMGAPWGNLAQHARTVRNWARLRRAVEAFRKLSAEGSNADILDVDGWLDRCEREAYDATASRQAARASVATYAEAGDYLRAGWERAASRDDRTWGTPTGFHRLDEHTMGMGAGQIWYVGARPGQGKTAFAQQIAEYVAERGGGKAGVVFLSQEMGRDELLQRAVARTSMQSARGILKRSDRVDWTAVADGTKRAQGMPILIDDEKGLTPIKVRAKVRRHLATLRKQHAEVELRLVVVDYVQLMSSDHPERHGTRAGELGAISSALAAMAGEFGCTMLVLSQLTRPTEKDKMPPPPTLFTFRDSGSIEADGNVVIGLHRPDQYRKPGEQHDHLCQVHVLKGRGCGEAAFELIYDGPTTHFDNIAPEQDSLWKPRDD